MTKYEIKEITWPARTFIMKKAKLTFDRLPEFFKEAYANIYSSLAGVEMKEMPCAFYYSLDEEKKETSLAAAVPVPENTPDVPGFEKTTFPPSKLAMTTHIGPYETMAPAYAALEGHMDALHLKKEMVIEEYFSDPEAEKNPANWKTNIYFVIKQEH